MSKELKPCPFCGGEAKVMGDERKPPNNWKFSRAWCGACSVLTANYATIADASGAWNRRAHGTDSEPATEMSDGEYEEWVPVLRDFIATSSVLDVLVDRQTVGIVRAFVLRHSRPAVPTVTLEDAWQIFDQELSALYRKHSGEVAAADVLMRLSDNVRTRFTSLSGSTSGETK